MGEKMNTLLRADIYRILALGFDFPSRKNLKNIQSITEDLLSTATVDPSLQQYLQKLKVSAEENLSLESEYHRLFDTQVAAPPCEGGYHLSERGPVVGDITAFYKAFQMQVMPEQCPPDHIKMELVFMSYMALKEKHAEKKGLQEASEVTRKAQVTFLEDHLGRWISPFLERLRDAAAHPFYQTLAKLL